jgi:hypothetical protein
MTRPTKRELAVWEREWLRPQAVMWEQKHLEEEVAQYVRTLCRFEKPGALAAWGTQMSRLADDLGLSMEGLAKHRWIIGAGEQRAAVAAATDARRGPASSARDRFEVVDGGA